jgi:hypothetical protein
MLQAQVAAAATDRSDWRFEWQHCAAAHDQRDDAIIAFGRLVPGGLEDARVVLGDATLAAIQRVTGSLP